MARYARIFSSIWSDPDFVALTANTQRLYLLLFSQPDVSHCGVLPLTERRWARLALDTDADSVRAALQELVDNRFVLIDEHTEEILIRSYLKYDGQWNSPNGVKAIEKAGSQVLSKALHQVVTDTLKALRQGASEAPPEGASEGNASPQQPAASSRDPQPAAAAPPPGRRSTSGAAPADLAAAFEETIRLALDHRQRNTTGIRNPKGWRDTVRPGIENEHGDRIRLLLADGMTPPAIVAAIYDTGPRRRTEADNARSAARARLLTGSTPAEAYTDVIASYPHQHDAICAELDWTPEQPPATVTPIRSN